MNKRWLFKIGVVCALGAGLLLFVCFRASRAVSKEELLGFLTNPENGLIKCDSLNHVTYQLCYRPKELVQYNSLSRENGNALKLSDQSLYFVLKCSFLNNDLFSHDNVPYNYTKALSNVSFNLGQYIFAVLDKKDTIPLKNALYARGYGATHSSDVLLLFDAGKNYKQCDVLVYDFVFESGQRIKLNYTYRQMQQCPPLKPAKNP